MVARAIQLPLSYVIVKYGYPQYEALLKAANIPHAVERFVYADQPEAEGAMLANAVDAGAAFVVINAEGGGGWEDADATVMWRMLGTFRARHPHIELYASIDTRGGRPDLPAMRALIDACVGIMPMVYPWDFEQSVTAAFAAALDHFNPRGKPVIPTIQTYPNDDGPRPGFIGVKAQIAEVHRRGLPGYNIYTLGHAADDEWRALVEEECTMDTEARRIAQVDSARMLAAGDALADNMQDLVALLTLCQILPEGTTPLFPSIDAASKALTSK
jgi:hypothetical protein